MVQTSNRADALEALIHLPDGEDLRVLDDDALTAYAAQLDSLVEAVSKDIKFREIAKHMRQTSNDSDNCDIVTYETVTTDRNKILGKKPPLYRRKSDLPDPSQHSQAEVNRKLRKLNPRISPDHVDLFNELSELYPTKREALEDAIEFLAHARLEKN